MKDQIFLYKPNHHDGQTNKNQHRVANLDNISVPMKLKEQFNQTVNSQQQGEYTRNNLNTDLIKLTPNLPTTNINSTVSGDQFIQAHHTYDQTYALDQKQNHTTAYTNPQNMREEYQHNIVRGARLQPTLSVQEGFEGRGTRPVEFQENIPHNLQQNGNGVNKGAYNMFAGRFQ